MNKILCTLLFFSVTLSAQAQYLPVVKQNRVWYSFYAGMFDGTSILAVGPDSLVNGRMLPTLVRKDQYLNTTKVLGTLDEDTVQGTLKVNLGGAYSYTLNFAAAAGDSMQFSTIANSPVYLKVDSVYTTVDFRNVARKVLVLKVPSQSFCQEKSIVAVEGLGPMGSLEIPNHDCSVSDIPQHTLRCVFDDGEKIYGDTVQQCFVLSKERYELTSVSVYPNPAGNFLQIETAEELASYNIISVSGNKVQAGELKNHKVSIANLLPGTYFLHLLNEEGKSYRQQFLKF